MSRKTPKCSADEDNKPYVFYQNLSTTNREAIVSSSSVAYENLTDLSTSICSLKNFFSYALQAYGRTNNALNLGLALASTDRQLAKLYEKCSATLAALTAFRSCLTQRKP